MSCGFLSGGSHGNSQHEESFAAERFALSVLSEEALIAAIKRIDGLADVRFHVEQRDGPEPFAQPLTALCWVFETEDKATRVISPHQGVLLLQELSALGEQSFVAAVDRMEAKQLADIAIGEVNQQRPLRGLLIPWGR